MERVREWPGLGYEPPRKSGMGQEKDKKDPPPPSLVNWEGKWNFKRRFLILFDLGEKEDKREIYPFLALPACS